MLLTSFSKHSVLIPRGQSVSAVTGGLNIFAKIDSTLCVSLRSRRYSRAQGGKLEIPPAQKLSILSSPAAG